MQNLFFFHESLYVMCVIIRKKTEGRWRSYSSEMPHAYTGKGDILLWVEIQLCCYISGHCQTNVAKRSSTVPPPLPSGSSADVF